MERLMDDYRISPKDCIKLSEEPLSEEEKNRILAQTFTKIEKLTQEQKEHESVNKEAAARPQTKEGEGKEMKRRSRSPKRVAVLAAAAVLCFGMVFACATGAIQVGESFRSFFGMEDGTEVEGMNKPLGIIAEDNGWKADFQEALGDSQSVYVRFDLIAPEGTVLDAESYNFIDSNISIEKPVTALHQTEGYAWGFEVLEAEDVKGDNILPVMLCADYSEDLTGKNMQIQLESLRGWYPAGEGAEEGTSKEYGDFCLKTEISLDYVKKSVVKDVNAAVSLEGSPWIMNTVEISPISVILNFEADTAFREDAEKKLSAKTADDSELVLVMKDGTRRSDWQGWSSNTVGNEAFIIYEAAQVLHPEEIAAIEFNGETFSLQ
ncbi:MAG: hypothetical protein ACI4VM_06195 [Anaerovoracaceae bacterium]